MTVRANLLGGLVDYWPLTEETGGRSSLTGRNNLTNNNTVTTNPGLFGRASQFVATNLESLTKTDNADLSIGGSDFTLSTWIYMDDISVTRMIASKQAGGGNREYQLLVEGTLDAPRLTIFSGTAAVGTATWGSAISPSVWYLVTAWYSGVANLVGISVDGQISVVSATTGAPVNGTASFAIGGEAFSGLYMDGRIESFGFWKRVLDPSEISFIYNNGIGRPLFTV